MGDKGIAPKEINAFRDEILSVSYNEIYSSITGKFFFLIVKFRFEKKYRPAIF